MLHSSDAGKALLVASDSSVGGPALWDGKGGRDSVGGRNPYGMDVGREEGKVVVRREVGRVGEEVVGCFL